MAIIYGLKVNLSIAIVAMVNHTALATNTSSAEAGLEDGPLVWSSAEQGAVLGAYFLGYLATQVPGGRLAETTSAKRVFLAAVVLNILPALATPPAARLGPAPVMLLRLVQGAGGGLSWEGEGFSGSPRGFLENICLNTALTECLFRCDLSNCAQKCADLMCRDRREA